jgi:sugar-specific transcriptional regulator TrmB/DNA-binding CsgD family transcriptional regulator
MLDILGLEPDEERVYRALLSRPEADMAEIQAELGLTEERFLRLVERLSGHELVRPGWRGRRSVRPVDPDVGLRLLLASRLSELAEQQRAIEHARGAVSQIVDEHTDHRARSAHVEIERIEGIDAIRDKIFELTLAVRSQVAALVPSARLSEANVKAAQPQDQRLLERGVRMRTLYLDSIRNHPPSYNYARWLAEQGGQVRSLPTLPLRMILCDGDQAVIPVDPSGTDRAVLVVRSPGIVTALHALFETMWTTARPLVEAGCRDAETAGGQELTMQDKELLRLLAQGLTDEAMAARMGVSKRTINRLNSGLMRRMDVRSRFQAGARAIQQGWISAEDLES